MLDLALVTLFRDSTWYLHKRFAPQAERLAREWPGAVTVYGVEGDSEDGTLAELRAWESKVADSRPPGLSMRILKHDGGLRRYGSVDHQMRYKVLADCTNKALDAVAENGKHDLIWYVDSDYMWSPSVPLRLAAHSLDAVAPYPMLYSRNMRCFYDTWGFAANGRPFKQWKPYFPGWRKELHRLDCCGASLMFKPRAVYDGLRYTPTNCIRAFSKLLQSSAGYELWADPTVRIWHLRRGLC